MKPKVIVIAGPTASGKTGLSIEVAKRLNGEVVSADSMQVYKDMNIGTAKVTKEEAQGIKHYLIDVVSPDERYTVSNFNKDALEAIEKILAEGKTPIVVGGTGLYIDSLIYGIEYQEMKFDEDYREYLMKKAESPIGLKELYDEAMKIDPEAMKKIFFNGKKRITRVLEIYKATGKTKTELEKLSRAKGVKYDYKIFAISRDREELYDRINRRVDIMLENGLIDEAKYFYNKERTKAVMTPIGYKELFDYFDNKCTLDEAVDKIKQNSRHYAKRQFTWFKNKMDIKWFNVDFNNFDNTIKEVIDYIDNN